MHNGLQKAPLAEDERPTTVFVNTMLGAGEVPDLERHQASGMEQE
jgi:hypothetical protein